MHVFGKDFKSYIFIWDFLQSVTENLQKTGVGSESINTN
jgi:hypothetical protein